MVGDFTTLAMYKETRLHNWLKKKIYIYTVAVAEEEPPPADDAFTSWDSPATSRSVKRSRQQQQKLTGLLQAASEGRKRRLKAALPTHSAAAP